jgi:hypothetical protein
MTEINHNTLTLNGVKYVREDSIEQNSPPMGSKRIIVADRGWVFLGDCVNNEDGTVTIHNALNIRRWGTTRGLGELANGPTAGTKTDPCGTVRCSPIVEINVIKGW